MSSLNQLEIISRGSFEIMEIESDPSMPPPSNFANLQATTRQMSLEPLPPEKPRYLGCLSTNDGPFSEEEENEDEVEAEEEEETEEEEEHGNDGTLSYGGSQLHANQLLQQMKELSGRIGAKLNVAQDITSNNQRKLVSSPNNVQSSLVEWQEGVEGSPGPVLSNARDHRGDQGEDRRGNQGQDRRGDQGEDQKGDQEGDRRGDQGELSQLQTDQKLLKALEKMKRLDQKLEDLLKREKEVKRQRRQLEQEMTGTQFPDDDGYLRTVSPVFQTQVVEATSRESLDSPGAVPVPSDGETTPTVSLPGVGAPQQSEHGSRKTCATFKHQHRVDFIQRNIELAIEAGTLVLMTETERQRLEELLAQDQDNAWTADDQNSLAYLEVHSNHDYGRHIMSDEDKNTLSKIDSQLQTLTVSAVCESRCSSRGSELSHVLQTSTSEPAGTTENPPSLDTGPGDEGINHFQVSQEEDEKLKEIEEKLYLLQTDRELHSEIPVLNGTELQNLLDECRKEQQINTDLHYDQPDTIIT